MTPAALIAAAAAGYLAGSFPAGYLAGRAFGRVDIRKLGSGNTGATNVFRTLGAVPGVIVLAADIIKGFLPVMLISSAFFSPRFGEYADWAKLAAGVSAVCGHNWPVFLRFRGGKGVATSVGVLLGIAPAPLSLSAAVWLLVFISSGYVSLSSLAGAASLPLFMNFFGESPEVFWMGILIAVFIAARHRSNIVRLMRGKENRFRLKKTAAESGFCLRRYSIVKSNGGGPQKRGL